MHSCSKGLQQVQPVHSSAGNNGGAWRPRAAEAGTNTAWLRPEPTPHGDRVPMRLEPTPHGDRVLLRLGPTAHGDRVLACSSCLSPAGLQQLPLTSKPTAAASHQQVRKAQERHEDERASHVQIGHVVARQPAAPTGRNAW